MRLPLDPVIHAVATVAIVVAVILRAWMRHRTAVTRARLEHRTEVTKAMLVHRTAVEQERARGDRLRTALMRTDPRHRPDVLTAYQGTEAPPLPPDPLPPDSAPPPP